MPFVVSQVRVYCYSVIKLYLELEMRQIPQPHLINLAFLVALMLLKVD